MSENFSEIFKNEAVNFKPGNLIEGEVIDIKSEYVVVGAGLKSESIIPIQQFQNESGELEIQQGDRVEVVVDSLEDGSGMTRLSREKAKRAQVWASLEKAFADSTVVQGIITSKVKGGFLVNLNSVSAFLPGSLVDFKPMHDTSYLEGKEHPFKIIKLDYLRNNAIVSRRAAVESDHSSEREELLNNLEKGKVIKGIVKNLTDYGAFMDLGGIDGLLHITDMSWKRIKHPSEIVSIGDEIEVKVLDYDKERMRVSLGLKQFDTDPWLDIKKIYPIGTRTFGKVTNITDYGCFVEIEDGAEGLVHISELDWHNKNTHPSKVVSVGQEVEVMVLDIDHDRRRISLGTKQCKPNPWKEFSEKYNIGDKLEGTIKLVTDFGLFVGIEDFQIDGLVHSSDISWTEPGEEKLRDYKKGDKVSVVILSVNIERERIALGIKQLQGNPTADYLNKHPKNSIVSGKIIGKNEKSFQVELAELVVATLPFSGLVTEEDQDRLKEGDQIEAALFNVDKRNGMITLSIRTKEEDEKKQAIKDYRASGDSAMASIEEKVKKLIGREKK